MSKEYHFPAAGLLTVLIVAAGLFTPLGRARADPAFPPMERIVAQFQAVAFGHEHGAPLGVLQKWDGRIQLAVFGQPSFDVKPHLGAVNRTVGLISALTGIEFTASASFDEATLRLGFLPRAEFRRLSRGADRPGGEDPDVAEFLSTSACLAVAVSDGEQLGHIKQGTIVIGSDISAPLQRHCLLEELVQVLGLPNDACHYRPSLFCEDDYVKEMTPADRILVRTLYDRRLLSGMTRAESLPVVRAIVQRMLRAGGA